MITPNVPTGPIVTKDENPTTEWKMFFSQLVQGMQIALSNEGFQLPSQVTEDIAKLTSSPNGTLIYDSKTNEPKVRVSGTFKVIETK
jgi:hypothetical protein